MLENKDMKISFIAFEVGYNDVSHFIQSFKKKLWINARRISSEEKKSSENKEKKLYSASKNIHKVASVIMLKSNSRKAIRR